MNIIISIGRYALPVLGFLILLKCFVTLLIGHPHNEDYAFIESLGTNERMALNTWETSIGKSRTCDIVLDFDVISRFHAVICRRVDGWYVFDTLSKNGTYVRKQPGAKPEKVEMEGMLIEEGNIICFSNKEFRFTKASDPVMTVGKKTPKRKNKATGEQPGDNGTVNKPIKKPESKNKQAALINRRNGNTYFLAGSEITIGRRANSDIRLADQYVSKLHAVLTNKNGVWYIEDQKSVNKTFVNGRDIGSVKTALYGGEIISIGAEQFAFIEDYK